MRTGGCFRNRRDPWLGGMGDDVVALDANRDGRAEFLVLSGSEDSTGPIQRIRLVFR